LEASVRRHAEIDVHLNHAIMSRRMAQHLPSVSVEQQRVALDHLVFLLDLNHRSWNMLHDYYSDEAKAICPIWLGQSPQEVLSWSARFEV
jgi:hypothetical protein